MIQSTLFATLIMLSSFVAVNGAVAQADGPNTVVRPSQLSSLTHGDSAARQYSPSTPPRALGVRQAIQAAGSIAPINNMVTQATTVPAIPGSMPLPRSEDPCANVPVWIPNFAFSAGDRTLYYDAQRDQLTLYTAKEWSWDSPPPTHPDDWVLGGCPQGAGTPIIPCKNLPRWANNVAYPSGTVVVFEDLPWKAVQWTEGNQPGDASGSWKPFGGCNLIM